MKKEREKGEKNKKNIEEELRTYRIKKFERSQNTYLRRIR